MIKVKSALPDWERILPNKPFLLTDKQWKMVVVHSGLPSEARPLVGRAIAMYHIGNHARRQGNPAKTRAELAALGKRTLDLRKSLAKLLDNPRAHVALTLGNNSPQEFAGAMRDKLAHRRIENAMTELDGLGRWLSVALNRVAKGKPGAKEKALLVQLFVAALDYVLQRFTGRAISRSYKNNFVQQVCRIADPEIGRGTIDDAIKRLRKSRGGIANKSSR